MQKAFISPSKYIQGKDTLNIISNYTSGYGRNILVLISNNNLKRYETRIKESYKSTNTSIAFEIFKKECTQTNIDAVTLVAQNKQSDLIIGIGGGKILDAAKVVTSNLKIPVIIVPTIASTDAPCSSLSVIYDEKGTFEKISYHKNNPELVLVDTQIIAEAPVRFLISGMGDALSTYFEARACKDSNAKNIAGFNQTNTALALSKLCYKILLKDSLQAISACKENKVTPELENIIEANILLSGLGFESGGLAAAHSIHNGLSLLEETQPFFHGEKVAFGTLVQLILEEAKDSEISTVLEYCLSVGLPTCLKDLNCDNVNNDRLMKVAEKACDTAESIHNMPFTVTPQMVFNALIKTDKLSSCKSF